MQALLNALSSPGTMTGSQWLVLAIGLFIVLGSLYFILKLVKIFRSIGKSTYTPKIGLSRHPYRGEPVSKGEAQEEASNEAGNSR
jgi:hypothetical protein